MEVLLDIGDISVFIPIVLFLALVLAALAGPRLWSMLRKFRGGRA